MEINTSRFGSIPLEDYPMIQMHGPLLGFEHLNRYILIQQKENSAFWWLQSVEDGAVAFIVINPSLIKDDYAPEVRDDDVALLEIKDLSDVLLLGVVTIRSNPTKITVNMRAPIVINVKKRFGKQIVLDDDSYEVQHRIDMDSK
jgi:flagellar assembly factor FliW